MAFLSSELPEPCMDGEKLRGLTAVSSDLGISEKTLRRIIDNGLIGHYKIGRRILISSSQVASFLRQAEVHPFDAQAVARSILKQH